MIIKKSGMVTTETSVERTTHLAAVNESPAKLCAKSAADACTGAASSMVIMPLMVLSKGVKESRSKKSAGKARHFVKTLSKIPRSLKAAFKWLKSNCAPMTIRAMGIEMAPIPFAILIK